MQWRAASRSVRPPRRNPPAGIQMIRAKAPSCRQGLCSVQLHVIDHQPRRDFFQRIGGDAELVSRGVRQLNGKVKRTGVGMRYAIVFRDTFLRINTGTADSVPASLNRPFAPSRAFADSARPLQKTPAQRA